MTTRTTSRAAILALAGLALAAPAGAQDKLPPTIVLGAQQPGSLQHTVATGLAKIATQGTKVPVIVRPHSGSSTHIPLLNRGEIDLSVAPSVDAAMSFLGKDKLKIGGVNPYPRAAGIRLVMSGSPLLAGLIVRKDSKIKSAADLKGQRVAGGFPSGLGAYINTYVHLLGAGLTWNDVNMVPFGGLNDGLNALIQGRIDATVYGVGAPRVREADATVGVRFVTDDCSPDGKARIAAAAPGYYTIDLKPGRLPGITENICVTAYAIYLLGSDKTSGAVVTAVLNALWDGTAELRKLHPGLRLWRNETAAPDKPTVPFHPAAVAFYKSKNLWSDAKQAAQDALMAEAK